MRSCCLICRSLARMRLRIVVLRTMNRPNPFFPLRCLKLRKSNVSGLPSPLRSWFCWANRPNSIRRVWSGWSSKLPQSLSQVFQKVIGVRLILESHDGVIGIPDYGIPDYHDLALRILPAPDVHPEIETVVQVNIREERRNHAPF
jgi:hypothetical protein